MSQVEFFASEYVDEDWIDYINCFEKVVIEVDGMPTKITSVVITLLGEKTGINWLKSPLLDEMTAYDLVQFDKGEKALKAFIMRLPN